MERKCFSTKLQASKSTGKTNFQLVQSTLSVAPLKTSLYIGRGLLQSPLLQELTSSYSSIVLVVDASLSKLYGNTTARFLGASLFTIPSGEKAKSRVIQAKVEDFLAQNAFGKETLLIGLGGGATLDLVAFVSSIYMRGIPLLLIPTTLLAMIDASLGGKTAINTPFGKNLLGSFYLPKAVLADLDTLETLPEKEWQQGLTEIVKLGLVAKSSLLSMVEQYLSNTLSLEELILNSARAKLDLIEHDPFDRGARQLLNFGHTFGHAFETVSNYHMSHGAAITLGMLAESHVSLHMGLLSIEDYQKIQTLLHTLFPSFLSLPPGYTRALFLEALQRDKKRKKESHLILLTTMGVAARSSTGGFSIAISEKELESTLSMLESFYG